MSSCYFWKDGAVLVVPERVGAADADQCGYTGMFCVDTFVDTDVPKMRYGMFEYGRGWEYHPLESFPTKFRMHLLLLGVS